MKFLRFILILNFLMASAQDYSIQHFEDINNLTKDENGNIYLIGERSVCKFRGVEHTENCFFSEENIDDALIINETELITVSENRFTIYQDSKKTEDILLDEIITSIAYFNNSILIGTLGSGLYAYALKDKSINQFLEEQFINDIKVNNNQVYVLTDEELVVFNSDLDKKASLELSDIPIQIEFDKLNQPVILTNNSKLLFLGSDFNIVKVYESKDYKLKAITFNQNTLFGLDELNLLRWDDQKFKVIKQTPLEHIIDAQNVIITTNKKTLQINNLLTRLYNVPKTFSIFAEGDKFWLGNEGKISLFNKGNIEKEIIFPKAYTGIYVASLVKKNDLIYAGTMGRGILMFNTKTGEYLGNYKFGNDSVSQQNIIQLHLDGDLLWIGYLNGLAITRITTNELLEDYSHLIDNNYLYRFHVNAPEDFFLCTTDAGLIHYKHGQVNSYLEKSTVYSIAETDTALYFSVEDKGVFKLNDTIENLSENKYIRSDNIFNLVGIEDRLLLAHNYGVDVYNQQKEDISYFNFEKLEEANLNAYAIGKSKILLAFENALVEFDKNQLKNSGQKLFELDTPILFDYPVDRTQTTFNYNENTWTFRFSETKYLNPKDIYYKYRLMPLEKEWIATTQESISYYNLPSADYHFEVSSGEHRNFVPRDILSYKFKILKPIWENPIFWIAMFLLVVALVFIFIKYREKQIKKQEALKNIQLEYEYQRLKDQIDPHFLFNSFNSLIGIVEENPKKGTKVLEQLSALYRSILEYEKHEVIPLGEELGLITKYFEIHKLRFQDLIHLHISEKINTENKFVIPFSLQLLVENAIKHNVINSSHKLDIYIFEENDFLVVKNTSNPKKNHSDSLGLGLKNLIKRHEMRLHKTPVIEKNQKAFIVKIPVIHA